MHIFKDIYDYRELLKTNVKKDIRGKYKGSFLGVLWSFINPLLQVVVYWIVFPYLMRGAGGDNYLVYILNTKPCFINFIIIRLYLVYILNKSINKRVKMEPTVNKIGKIIKKRRKELNLELKDLQDYSGVNYASISDIENGKANPTIKTLEKLLDVLGMEINIEVVSK